MLSNEQIFWAVKQMEHLFPNAEKSLVAETPFQYLVAVMLSAQATDVSVNLATPKLFADFPTAKEMSEAPIEKIENDIRSIGLYRSKAKHIKETSQILETKFGGEVPKQKAELVKLPGVGNKTANVVLGDVFGIPEFAVDTHIFRISKRLTIVPESADVLKTEHVIKSALPPAEWIRAHHTFLEFGRNQCTARNPKCATCPLIEICPFGKNRVGGF